MFKSASGDPAEFRAYYMRVYGEHGEMIDLIRSGDGDRLQEISRRHTKLFSDRVVQFMTQRIGTDAIIQNFELPDTLREDAELSSLRVLM